MDKIFSSAASSLALLALAMTPARVLAQDLPPAGGANETGASVWGNAEVVGYLTTFGPDKTVTEDPFVTPTSPLLPESVVLTFPISPRADWASTYWTYDREAQTMTIVASEDQSAATGAALVSQSPPHTALSMRGWALTARRTPPQREWIGNREIPVRVLHVTGFGQVVATAVPGPRPDARIFRHTFSINPDAARSLSGELELRVSGKVRPWRDGEQTLCVTNLDNLRSGIRERSCFLTGVLETYQVIDKRDGSVIHEWDAKSKS